MTDQRDRMDRSYASRMRREARWLGGVSVRLSAADPVAEVESYLSVRLAREWRRSVRRHARAIGVAAAEVTASERLNAVLRGVGESLRKAAQVSPRMLAARAQMATVTAMTQARTAGALDAVDLHEGRVLVAAAGGSMKSAKRKKVKPTKPKSSGKEPKGSIKSAKKSKKAKPPEEPEDKPKKKRKKKAKLTKEWVSQGDKQVCGTCFDLDGTVVPAYTGTFQDDDGNDIPGPPEHPRCRCDLLISKGDA